MTIRYNPAFNPAAMRLVQLFAFLLIACHWSGCIWWAVGEIEYEYRDEISQSEWYVPHRACL